MRCFNDDVCWLPLLQGPTPATTPHTTKTPSTLSIIPLVQTKQLLLDYTLSSFTAAVQLQVGPVLLQSRQQHL